MQQVNSRSLSGALCLLLCTADSCRESQWYCLKWDGYLLSEVWKAVRIARSFQVSGQKDIRGTDGPDYPVVCSSCWLQTANIFSYRVLFDSWSLLIHLLAQWRVCSYTLLKNLFEYILIPAMGCYVQANELRGFMVFSIFFYWNPGQTRTLLQLKPVGILTINLFLT
jgi:hypothetical protein